jgi:hypothetical protein
MSTLRCTLRGTPSRYGQRQRIIALDSDKDNNASSLVVKSIEGTEILIDKLFFPKFREQHFGLFG